MSKELTLPSHILYSAALIWALIPCLLFFGGWFRWEFAIPVILIAVAASAQVIHRLYLSDRLSYSQQKLTPIKLDLTMAAALTILTIWLFAIGTSGYLPQETYDNSFRNATLEEMTARPWPPTDNHFAPFAYLSYYCSFWTLPAAVGKIFQSYEAAYAALFLWCWIGLALTLLMIFHRYPKRRLLTTLIFLLLSTPDWLLGLIFKGCGLYFGSIHNSAGVLSCNPTLMLSAVIYNQGIPLMVIAMLMLRLKNSAGALIMLFSLLLLPAPFMALGAMIPVAVGALRDWRNLLSLPAIAGYVMAILSIIFFLGNENGMALYPLTASADFQPIEIPMRYLAFFLFNYLLFIPFIWKSVRHDPIFWLLLPMMFVAPLWIMGDPQQYGRYDLGYKVPAVFAFYFLLKLIERCSRMEWNFRNWKVGVFTLLLIIGAMDNLEFYIHSARQWYYHTEFGYSNLRSASLRNRLFDPDAMEEVYPNFVKTRPTLYSRYFMPRRAFDARRNEGVRFPVRSDESDAPHPDGKLKW